MEFVVGATVEVGFDFGAPELPMPLCRLCPRCLRGSLREQEQEFHTTHSTSPSLPILVVLVAVDSLVLALAAVHFRSRTIAAAEVVAVVNLDDHHLEG